MTLMSTREPAAIRIWRNKGMVEEHAHRKPRSSQPRCRRQDDSPHVAGESAQQIVALVVRLLSEWR